MKLKSFHEGRYIVTGFTSTSDNPWPILQSHYNCKLQLLSSNRDNFIVITTLVSKYTNVAPFIMVATGSRFLLACSGQFHPSTSYRGRLTKFHPSTSSGSFGRLCACKQKLSALVCSTLLDDFVYILCVVNVVSIVANHPLLSKPKYRVNGKCFQFQQRRRK